VMAMMTNARICEGWRVNVPHVESVVVQLADAGPGRAPGGARRGRPRTLPLGPGQDATFGRGAPGRPVDIELPDKGVSRLAGRIEAAGDYWRVSNFSREATYVVETLRGAGSTSRWRPAASARQSRSSCPGS
jgi:hypothetical protein